MSDAPPPEVMTISVELVIAIVTSVAAIVVSAIPRFLNKDRRMKLLSDLEILEKLEKNSAAYDALKASIEKRIIATSDTGEKTRDWSGFTIGVLLLILGVFLFTFVNSLGGWWRLLHFVTGFLLLFGVFGAISSFLKKPRDEKGNVIKETKV